MSDAWTNDGGQQSGGAPQAPPDSGFGFAPASLNPWSLSRIATQRPMPRPDDPTSRLPSPGGFETPQAPSNAGFNVPTATTGPYGQPMFRPAEQQLYIPASPNREPHQWGRDHQYPMLPQMWQVPGIYRGVGQQLSQWGSGSVAPIAAQLFQSSGAYAVNFAKGQQIGMQLQHQRMVNDAMALQNKLQAELATYGEIFQLFGSDPKTQEQLTAALRDAAGKFGDTHLTAALDTNNVEGAHRYLQWLDAKFGDTKAANTKRLEGEAAAATEAEPMLEEGDGKTASTVPNAPRVPTGGTTQKAGQPQDQPQDQPVDPKLTTPDRPQDLPEQPAAAPATTTQATGSVIRPPEVSLQGAPDSQTVGQATAQSPEQGAPPSPQGAPEAMPRAAPSPAPATPQPATTAPAQPTAPPAALPQIASPQPQAQIPPARMMAPGFSAQRLDLLARERMERNNDIFSRGDPYQVERNEAVNRRATQFEVSINRIMDNRSLTPDQMLDQIGQMSPGLAAQARAIRSGAEPLPRTAGTNSYSRLLSQIVPRVDPSWYGQRYNFNQKIQNDYTPGGYAGRIVQSANRMAQAAVEVVNAGRALPEGPIPSNAWQQFLDGKFTGDNRYTNFFIAWREYSMEQVRLARGGSGTGEDIKANIEAVPPYASKRQIFGALQIQTRDAVAQLSGVRNYWQQTGMPRTMPGDNPEANAIFDAINRIDQNTGAIANEPPQFRANPVQPMQRSGQNLPRPKTPEEAGRLPPGTRFFMPDGSIGVVPGG